MSSETCEKMPVAGMNYQNHDVSKEVEMMAEQLRLKRIEEQNKKMYQSFLLKHPDGRLVPKY